MPNGVLIRRRLHFLVRCAESTFSFQSKDIEMTALKLFLAAEGHRVFFSTRVESLAGLGPPTVQWSPPMCRLGSFLRRLQTLQPISVACLLSCIGIPAQPMPFLPPKFRSGLTFGSDYFADPSCLQRNMVTVTDTVGLESTARLRVLGFESCRSLLLTCISQGSVSADIPALADSDFSN